MKQVIDVTPTSPKPLEWWQTARIDEFDDRIKAFSTVERRALLLEIRGALALAQKVAGDVYEHADRRARASSAVAYMVRKRRSLEALLQRDDAARMTTRALAADECRKLADAVTDESTRATLRKIIDLITPNRETPPASSDAAGTSNV